MEREFINSRNPLIPVDTHILDVEARAMGDGRLYLYGSLDDKSYTYCSDKYHVVSTADMKT